MTLDIRGSLKNTRISTNPLIVIDELLANCIDAYLIRQSNEKGTSPLHIKLHVTAAKNDLLGEIFDVEIVCQDNGCGLGPEQLKAFLTKDTSYKGTSEKPRALSDLG
jgi:sensor histidine kinase regulating citrate/malate metabolism